MTERIRLLAFDLDGTLLDSKKRFSERGRAVLTRMGRAGVCLVPTTGRPADGIQPEIRALEGCRYAITTNGGCVIDLKTGRKLYYRAIACEKAVQVLRIADRYPVMYDPYIDGRGKSQPRFLEHMDDFGLSPEVQGMVRMTRDSVPDLFAYMEEVRPLVEKVNIFMKDLSVKGALSAEIAALGGLTLTASLHNNLEVNAEGATKGNALTWLAGWLSIPLCECMAIGDGGNDVSMLKCAGHGIAMANAVPEAKEAADEVTLGNDEDGVAVALERYFP